ncbi:MAG TPA: response regulator [Acidimicrobiales bacterium]
MLRRSKTDHSKSDSKKSGAAAAPGANGAISVLIVNDDADACELLSRVIEHTGTVAYRSNGGEEALTELDDHGGSIAGVVLDFSSGTATSLSVLEEIRHHHGVGHPAVMIIATTDANRTLAFDTGVDEFLTRPFHVNEFTSAVGAMLARSPEEREAHRQHEILAGRGLTDLED